MTRTVTADTVAQALGLTSTHVLKLARDGELPRVEVAGRVRFLPDDIDAFIRAHRIPAKQQPEPIGVTS